MTAAFVNLRPLLKRLSLVCCSLIASYGTVAAEDPAPVPTVEFKPAEIWQGGKLVSRASSGHSPSRPLVPIAGDRQQDSADHAAHQTHASQVPTPADDPGPRAPPAKQRPPLLADSKSESDPLKEPTATPEILDETTLPTPVPPQESPWNRSQVGELLPLPAATPALPLPHFELNDPTWDETDSDETEKRSRYEQPASWEQHTEPELITTAAGDLATPERTIAAGTTENDWSDVLKPLTYFLAGLLICPFVLGLSLVFAARRLVRADRPCFQVEIVNSPDAGGLVVVRHAAVQADGVSDTPPSESDATADGENTSAGVVVDLADEDLPLPLGGMTYSDQQQVDQQQDQAREDAIIAQVLEENMALQEQLDEIREQTD